MAFRSAARNSGNGTDPSVAVPSGVAADDILILCGTIDASGASWAGGAPSGFAVLGESAIGPDGHKTAIFWKRATGADAGTYSFGSVGSTSDWIVHALCFSGRHTSNAPSASAVNVDNTSLGSPVSISANGLTALASDDLVWFGVPDMSGTAVSGTNSMSAPTGYTIPTGLNEQNTWSYLTSAYLEAASAGATGAVTGTFTMSAGSTGFAAWLIQIPIADAGTSGDIFYKRTRTIVVDRYYRS